MASVTDLDTRLVELVSAYSERIRGSVLAQHEGASISSPLGIWVLLCACLLGAEGSERERLEDLVGCPREEAGELLAAFVADVPEAVKAALALWARPEVITDGFERWAAQLPSAVEVGPIPTQDAADAWAGRNTLGLINKFPLDMAQMVVVLASAIATRVSWEHPFDVAEARERFSSASPWVGAVTQILSTDLTANAAIVDTEAAGLVAVYDAIAQEDLSVICVCADPAADRAAVLAAAHEVSARIQRRSGLSGHSLFDLPLGDGHSWTISEQERKTWQPGQRFERIVDVALPAWTIESELNLMRAEDFGAIAGLDVMQRLVAVEEERRDAMQVALAEFDRYGFKAAAITAFAIASSLHAPPRETGIERTARLRFDHPFAAIAVAGRPGMSGGRFRGLPLFEAWVHEPTEA